MSAVIEVTAEDGDRQLRSPLLHSSSLSAPDGVPTADTGGLILTSTPSGDHNIQSSPPTRRLASLDVFRGLTVALMILVDDAGGAIPPINHSPWFGVTLADFVMPFFLFGVGISVALVFKKIPNKSVATKKVIMRTLKLFLLGVLLQGGYFHGRKHLTFGVDVGHIRWMGVLQRISIGYFLASISEIWLVKSSTVDSSVAFDNCCFAVCAVYVDVVWPVCSRLGI